MPVTAVPAAERGQYLGTGRAGKWAIGAAGRATTGVCTDSQHRLVRRHAEDDLDAAYRLRDTSCGSASGLRLRTNAITHVLDRKVANVAVVIHPLHPIVAGIAIQLPRWRLQLCQFTKRRVDRLRIILVTSALPSHGKLLGQRRAELLNRPGFSRQGGAHPASPFSIEPQTPRYGSDNEPNVQKCGS